MYPANTKLSSLKSRLRIIVFGALLTLLFTSCGAPFGAEQSSSTPLTAVRNIDRSAGSRKIWATDTTLHMGWRHKRRCSLGHI